MRPSFESIGIVGLEAPQKGRPSFESIVAPVYDYGIIDRDERVQQFIANTQDVDDNTRARLVNSLYIADTYKVPFEQAYQNHDGVISELFGKGTTAESALKKIQNRNKTNAERFNDYDAGYYDKARAAGAGRVKSGVFSFLEKAKDRYNRMGITMVNELIGLVEATGDITFSETLQDWSESMRDGVQTYMQENPEEFLNPGGKGFWNTTWAYVSNPEYILLGAMEQTPNIALAYVGGVAGKAVAGAAGAGAAGIARAKWIGGIQGFAVPSFGRRYSDLRGDGVSPLTALPEAFLGSQVEGLIEEWTLSRKIQIFKNAGKAVERSIGTVVARTLLGGAKAYGRGMFEEGTQQISDNFLAILFRDVDIGLLNDVGNQAAAGGILEMAMAGGFHVAGTYSRQVDKTEKLQRLATFKERINEIPLNQTHKDEINAEIDALVEHVEKQRVILGEAKLPEPVAEAKEPPKNLIEEIERGQRYGIEETEGGWVVKDWETQQEVSIHKKDRQAIAEMNRLNQEGEPVTEATLPIEATNVRQMWQHLVKQGKITKAKIGDYLQGAKDVVKNHTNLAKWANTALKGLDISQSHRRQLLNAVSKPRTSAETHKAIQTILRIIDVSEHKKAVKDLKKTITWINRRVGKLRTEGGIAPDYLERIKAVTDTFLLKKISAKQRRRIKGLVTYLESIKSGEAVTYSEAYAESRIPKELLAKVEQLELRTVDDMTVKELDDINKTLQLLIHLNKTKNAIINRRTGERVAEGLNTAVEEANELKSRSTLTDKDTVDLSDRPDRGTTLGGWVKDISRDVFNFFAGNKNHNIETLTETISGGIHGSTFDILVNSLSDGYEVQNKFLDDWGDIRKKYLKDVSLEELQELSSLFFQWVKNPVLRASLAEKANLKQTKTYSTFKDRSGKTIKMTMADMMSVYMMTENTDTVNEMIKTGVASPKMRLGGITFDNIVGIRKQVEGNKLAMKLIEMAKEIKRFEASQINETSRELDGIDIADILAYWHRERFTGGGAAGHQAFRNSLLEAMGWLKEREGSGNPVIIRDFFETLIADQQAISEYVGMAMPYRNIKNLLNYKEYRDILQTKGYGEELKLIDSMIERTEQKPREFSVLDNAVSKIVHGLTRAVLANPGIMAGQIASLVPVLENEMSSKYAKSISLKTDKGYVDRLKAHWHTYKQRLEGMVSSIALQEVGESDLALRIFTGKRDFINYLTQGIHYVDSVAITSIGRAVEAEMADSNMNGVSADYWMNEGIDPATLKKDSIEYWDAFVKRANYVLRRTQPMFDTANRSVLTSEPSPTRRSLFLFRSYIDQPMRQAYRAMNDYNNGRINAVTVAKRISTLWAGLALYEIIRAAVRKGLFRSDEDEKDLIFAILTSPVKVLNVIGYTGQKIITEVADFKMTGDPIDLRYADLTPLPLQFVNDAITHTGSIARGIGYSGTGIKFESGRYKDELKSDIYLRKGLYGISSDILKYYGVPIRQIELLFAEKEAKKKGFL